MIHLVIWLTLAALWLGLPTAIGGLVWMVTKSRQTTEFWVLATWGACMVLVLCAFGIVATALLMRSLGQA